LGQAGTRAIHLKIAALVVKKVLGRKMNFGGSGNGKRFDETELAIKKWIGF